jgi:hypothetical protein
VKEVEMKRVSLHVAILSAVLLCAHAQAIDYENILFYADFEETVEARVAEGSAKLYGLEEEEQSTGRERPREGRPERSRRNEPEPPKPMPGMGLPGMPGMYPQPAEPMAAQATKIPGVGFGEGIIGKGVVVGNLPGYEVPVLTYSPKRNLFSYSGMICFWMRPVDWDSADGSSHVLFQVTGRDEYVVMEKIETGKTILTLKIGDKEYEMGMWKPVWKAGEWHHIAIGWQVGVAQLYVDGELKDLVMGSGVQFPRRMEHFSLGWSGESSTAFDELVIFTRPLSEEELRLVYTKHQREIEKPQVTVPMSSVVPRVDGRLKVYEYKNAAVISGFAETAMGLHVEDRTAAFVTYDAENLYVAFECPAPSGRSSVSRGPLVPKTDVTERDGPVNTDDSVFVAVKGTEDAKPKVFYVNASGALLDKDGDNAEWNSDAKVKTYGRVRWTVEMSIPLADLGLSRPRDGQSLGINVGRVWKKGRNLTAKWFHDFHAPSETGIAVLKEESATAHLESLGDLSTGTVDMKVSVSNPTRRQREFDITLEDARGAFSEHKRMEVRPDSSQEYTFSTLVPNSVSSKVLFQVKEMAYRDPIYRLDAYYAVSPEALASTKYDKVAGELTVPVLNVSDMPGARSSYSAKITLSRKGSADVMAEETLSEISKDAEQASFDVKDFPSGTYVCRAAFSAGGKELEEVAREFEIEGAPKWQDARVELPEKVYKPWLPMSVDGANVSMWGRTYAFEETLFPSRLVSQNRSVLARPMRCILSTDSGTVHLEQGEARVTRKAADRVEFRNAFSQKGINAEVEGFVEYDGFCWMKLKVEPKYGPVEVSRLQLEVPLDPKQARLYSVGSLEKQEAGPVPPRGWSGLAEAIWIGNEERGLEFVFASTKGWSSEYPDRQLDIIPRDAETLFICNFIDSPRELKEPREIEFGFIATPVRPLGREYQNWRFYLTQVTASDRAKELPALKERREQRIAAAQPIQPVGMPGATSGLPGMPGQEREMTLEDLSPEERKRREEEWQRQSSHLSGGAPPLGIGQGQPARTEPKPKPGPAVPEEKKRPPIVLEKIEMPISEEVKSLDLWWVNWSATFNYPEPTADAISLLKEHKEKRGYLLPYVTANLVSPFADEFMDFERKWQRIPQGWQDASVMVPAGRIASLVCPRSSYADFIVWRMQKALQQLEPGGVFLDNTIPLPCQNDRHGCGYVDERRERMPERPILAMRDFQKKIYAIMKDYDEGALVASNAMGTPYLSNVAFSDLLVNGFQNDRIRAERAQEEKSDALYDILPIGRFQAAYVGQTYGLPVVLYDGYTYETEATPRRTRFGKADDERVSKSDSYLLGLLLSHNTPLWYGRSTDDAPILDYLAEVRNFTGWDEGLEFYPYWGSEQVVSIEAGKGDDVVASAYKKKDAVLLVFFNDTDEDLTSRVSVDFKKLGLEALAEGSAIDLTGLAIRKREAGKTWERNRAKIIEELTIVFEKGQAELTVPKDGTKVLFIRSVEKQG